MHFWQKTFLQATVVFAPEVQDTSDDDFSFGFSYSYELDMDDGEFSDDWVTAADLYLPWADVMTETDLAALAESLAIGLDAGSTTGDIIVAETVDVSAISAATGPSQHAAAMVVNYDGAPEVSSIS